MTVGNKELRFVSLAVSGSTPLRQPAPPTLRSNIYPCSMPPRGNSEGLDVTPILTHYLFLFTSILAIVSFFSSQFALRTDANTSQFAWFIAFISQIVATAKCKLAFVSSGKYHNLTSLQSAMGLLVSCGSQSSYNSSSSWESSIPLQVIR